MKIENKTKQFSKDRKSMQRRAIYTTCILPFESEKTLEKSILLDVMVNDNFIHHIRNKFYGPIMELMINSNLLDIDYVDTNIFVSIKEHVPFVSFRVGNTRIMAPYFPLFSNEIYTQWFFFMYSAISLQSQLAIDGYPFNTYVYNKLLTERFISMLYQIGIPSSNCVEFFPYTLIRASGKFITDSGGLYLQDFVFHFFNAAG